MGRWSVPFILLLAATSSLRAQDGSPRLQLSLPTPMTARVDAPTVSLADILAEGHRREPLVAGFPTVLHCRVELWRRGRLFFDRESFTGWDVVVEFLPATNVYRVRRQQDGRLVEL